MGFPIRIRNSGNLRREQASLWLCLFSVASNTIIDALRRFTLGRQLMRLPDRESEA